jgi:hypothetical protein
MSPSSKISWGTMVAGAAVATGALLVAVAIKPDLLTSLGETFGSLGSALKDMGASIASSIGGMFGGESKPMAEGTKRLLQAAGGVALFGAGRSYLKGQSQAQEIQAAMAEADTGRMGWADREKMRTIQGIMQARMSMANQQMGRG